MRPAGGRQRAEREDQTVKRDEGEDGVTVNRCNLHTRCPITSHKDILQSAGLLLYDIVISNHCQSVVIFRFI